MSQQELREAQLALEVKYDSEAAAARLKELREAAASGDPETPRASKLIGRMYAAVQEELEVVAATVTRGMGGKYKTWLRALPKDLAAVIAIRECIKGAQYHSDGADTVQGICTNIGRAWELEVRVREAEAVNPAYMGRIHEQIRRRGTTSEWHIRNVYSFAYTRVMKGELDTRLTRSEMLQVGKFGLQACINAGLAYTERCTSRKGVGVYVYLNEEVHAFLNDFTEHDVRYVLDRQVGAMICVPDEWQGASDGGYLTPRRKAVCRLVQFGRNARPEYRRRVQEVITHETTPKVLEVANYLQSRAFRVHAPTMQAIRRLWQAGGGVLGVPRKNPPVKPECPFPEDWTAEGAPESEVTAFRAWKREAASYYDAEKSWKSRVRELGAFLRAGELHNTALYFPVYMDSRGRWYYRGTPNPQGTDLAKAVLHFDTKKPLGEVGLFWLKVHIANSLGFDKERFVDRARYTEQHWEALERALDAPEDYPEVWGNDAPWCAYSAAWELREAYRSGNPTAYASGIICHMDATCSGLQHFSAMLRDEIGGRYVNLVDENHCGPKQDIYSKVAAEALEAIKLDLQGDDPTVVEMARFWLNAGLPRALAKKPCMTYVYGATLRGTARHIEQYALADMGLEFPDPSNAGTFGYCLYAANKLFEGIAQTVPAAAAAMRWLQGQAGKMRNVGAMRWRTDLGFEVTHDYPKMEIKDVRVRSCGLNVTMVREILPGVDPARMRNAISPNFVHSQDATHLGRTALRMRDAGLDMVGIHDSFGTHMCDVPAMHNNLREAFVAMYNGRNVLGEFLWGIGSTGEAPTRGTLSIREVLDSEFFFC